MKIFSAILTILLLCNIAYAERATTFNEAVTLSEDLNKPILLEFSMEDCDYCEKAEEEAKTNPQIRGLLDQVIVLPLNAAAGEGYELKQKYDVGINYPVFMLVNSKGDLITRWTGYTTASAFIMQLKRALSDMTTIKEKIADFEASPSFTEARALARHFEESQEFEKAVYYWRQSEKYAPGSSVDYSFNIFQNAANASWNDNMEFDKVLLLADTVLINRKNSADDIIKTAKLLASLARKKNTTDQIGKYLQAGLNAAQQSSDSRHIGDAVDLRADIKLCIEHDTTEAVNIYKRSMGEGWERNPQKFYIFSKWCLMREVNLDEAAKYAELATRMARDPKLKASTFQTLAAIYDKQGNYSKAVGAMKQALQNTPDNSYYMELLEKYENKLTGN